MRQPTGGAARKAVNAAYPLSDPLSLAGAIKREVSVLGRNLPISDIGMLRESTRNTLKLLDASAAIIGFFAVVSLILATVGIYGVLSYTVGRQTHEIGIRIGLGAEPRHVLGPVMRRGVALALAGVAMGAFWAARLLPSLSAGQTPVQALPAADLVAFVTAPALLMFFGLLAVYIPARRSTKLDPAVALRCE